jgi:arylsulfatase A-like enzyme
MKHNKTSRTTVAFIAVLACGLRGAEAVADVDKPNIIFIFSDDLSYRDLSAYGQKAFTTPHLDALAVGGLRFTRAYAGSPECAPSRASLMTGMHMGHCRIRANRSVRGQDHLKSEDVTVAEILKQAGYATGFVGKWGSACPAPRARRTNRDSTWPTDSTISAAPTGSFPTT